QPTSVSAKNKSTIFREPHSSEDLYIGARGFQGWKESFPRVEILFSSLGNLFFQGWKLFGNPRNSPIFATFVVDIRR
ncbi:hypothetical protein, partial [uncultured Porphyromonas sp.]|uniref:hypothetical protein n=1 Tax=uncultured Porphyromonas sp. TaxID=159274 RepID=UPI0026029835